MTVIEETTIIVTPTIDLIIKLCIAIISIVANGIMYEWINDSANDSAKHVWEPFKWIQVCSMGRHGLQRSSRVTVLARAWDILAAVLVYRCRPLISYLIWCRLQGVMAATTRSDLETLLMPSRASDSAVRWSEQIMYSKHVKNIRATIWSTSKAHCYISTQSMNASSKATHKSQVSAATNCMLAFITAAPYVELWNPTS